MPLWHPISISGYHIREAGSTAAQELAFTLADGFTYVEWALERGLDVDDFAPRLSFFFNAHLDFFEEIAKYRAARRIWARGCATTYGAKNPRSLADALPHADGGRVADGAAAGGEPRPHGDRGARGGARRHAVAAHEQLRRGAGAADRACGAARAAHAAGDRARDGCRRTRSTRSAARYYVEHLTNELERQAYEYFERIDELGGVVAAIKQNFFQPEIAEASLPLPARGRERRSGSSSASTATSSTTSSRSSSCSVDPALERKQIERVRALRAPRDSAAVEAALARLKEDAARDGSQPDAGDHRRGARARDDGRDVRRAAARCGASGARRPVF